MVKHLNCFLLKLVYHKVASLGHLFSLFILMICPVTQSVSTVKLFSDDTSIFSVVDAANISADKLNKDL